MQKVFANPWIVPKIPSKDRSKKRDKNHIPIQKLDFLISDFLWHLSQLYSMDFCWPLHVLLLVTLYILQGPEPSLKRKMEDRRPKSEDTSLDNDNSSYDLLLKQQQLFLQWQLENQNKVGTSSCWQTVLKTALRKKDKEGVRQEEREMNNGIVREKERL